MEELRDFMDKNLARGFIHSAKVAVPVLFKEKKDGSLKLYVDFWEINGVCMENVYPFPIMKDIPGYVSKGKVFTKLDWREAYW